MKIPLRFQITEFDCGTIALQNAISYLYDRENVPAELVRAISIYTVNCYDERGNISENGTSRDVMENMTVWIDNFLHQCNFNLNCRRYVGENIDLNAIKQCVDERGCALFKTYRDGMEHFVIITMMDEEFLYIWDSYYLGETYYDSERKISIIFNKPFHYNRKVSIERFLETSTKDFALGPVNERECLLFNKTL